MKVFLRAVLFFALCAPALSLPARAASGDVAGDYYYTDIKTYMYRAPVTSYNIGGQTVIEAEALNWHYGFDVYWHEGTRVLEISDKGGMINSGQAASGELCRGAFGTPGDIAGSYYKTDIITLLNGEEIESYNIGGKTCITAEQMRRHGYDVFWNEGGRELTVLKPPDFYTIETDFGSIKSIYNHEVSSSFFMRQSRGIILTHADNSQTELKTESGCVLGTPGGHSYVALADLAAAFGGRCTLSETFGSEEATWWDGAVYETKGFSYAFDFSYPEGASPALNPEVPEEFEVVKFTPTEKYYALTDVGLTINERPAEFTAMYGGREFLGGIFIVDGKVYAPAYLAAILLKIPFAR